MLSRGTNKGRMKQTGISRPCMGLPVLARLGCESFAGGLGPFAYIWQTGCSLQLGERRHGGVCMNGARSGTTERRKWTRLPLAIPVFVRSRDGKGKEFLEFATSLNVSAGGMLVAIRRSLPAVAQIRLEIPSAPVASMALLPRAARTLDAKTLRTTPAHGYYLLGLKFIRPLKLSKRPPARGRKFLRTL